MMETIFPFIMRGAYTSFVTILCKIEELIKGVICIAKFKLCESLYPSGYKSCHKKTTNHHLLNEMDHSSNIEAKLFS
jgi:hypothetical protein